LNGYRLLQGGTAAADIEAIEHLLLRVSRLVEEVPEIEELDLNPVMALPLGPGCLIVDARICLMPKKQNGRLSGLSRRNDETGFSVLISG
jgi:ATP-grasp domain